MTTSAERAEGEKTAANWSGPIPAETDIVARLRKRIQHVKCKPATWEHKAADEIERLRAAILAAEQQGRNSAATEILESIEADRLRASPGPAYRSGFMFARECAMRAAKRLVVASTLTAPKGNDRE